MALVYLNNVCVEFRDFGLLTVFSKLYSFSAGKELLPLSFTQHHSKYITEKQLNDRNVLLSEPQENNSKGNSSVM